MGSLEWTINPRILVYHPTVSDRYQRQLMAAGLEHVFAAGNPIEAKAYLPEADVLFCWGMPSDLLQYAPKLKWIQSMGAGVDSFVYGSCPFPDNVWLTRIVNQYGAPMAEYVWSFLLYAAKGLPRLLGQQRNCQWKPFIPQTLSGKTIGMAGLGSIGSEMVRKARAFDMCVHGLSYSGARAHLVDAHFGPDEWLPFVRDLDVLVLILPLTAQTYHVVNADVLAAMKPGATLVNVGRGKLVDESALVASLQHGKLGMAALDVFEEEPLAADSPLWTLPNVYVTPHVSGLSEVKGTTQFFQENLERLRHGEAMHGLVQPNRQY